MQGLRDIKRRIKSVRNTQQITSAMHMVAAAKLRSTQDMVDAIKPFVSELEGTIADIMRVTHMPVHPFFSGNEKGQTGIIVISGEKGLCGAYNGNVIRYTLRLIEEKQDSGLVCVGRKARDFFARRNYDIMAEYINLPDKPRFRTAIEIAENVIELYNNGIFKEVYLIYTDFLSVLKQKPQVLKVLPIERELFNIKEKRDKNIFIYEPSPDVVLGKLLPRYVDTQFYRGLVVSKVSEYAARMNAMNSATDNAEEMLEDLTLQYNRARQADITQELSEIVGGAEALK